MVEARYEGILFDMYDTLCTIDEDLSKKLVAASGAPASEHKRLRKALFTTNANSVEDLFRIIGAELDAAEWENRYEQVLASMTLFPEVIPVLSELRQSGVPLGLVSNTDGLYRRSFYRLGLDSYVQNPVFSCELGVTKPDRQIYLHACKNLGIRPENVLMIGDSYEKDVEGAKSAGLQAVHLDRKNKGPGTHISDLRELLVNVG